MLKLKLFVISLLSLCMVWSAPALSHKHQHDGHELVQDAHRAGTEIDIDEDQDEVYQAVKQGLIRPFSELYAMVDQELNGRVIKVELEEDDDEWVYELKLVHDDNIIKVEFNATTLEMLEIKGRNLREVIKNGKE